jgi:TorA maturation chaperone TorD
LSTMRDAGLQEAIQAVGSLTELARRVGISQPSLSNWNRVPAERVIAVERATGVARAVLRPDLYAQGPAPGVDETDIARAQEYVLLSRLLRCAPDAALLDRLTRLSGDASPLGRAHASLAEAASCAKVQSVEREYFSLFIGVARGELLPYASYYRAGFLYDRPLARLRNDLARIGIERAEGEVEPEDHAAVLCEIMAGLAGGQLAAAAGTDREMFERHLAPWIGRLFADLERAKAADFYRHVGALGRVFVGIELEAFALPA